MSHPWYKLPSQIASRSDLTATAKVIYAIIKYRVGVNGCCWPGLRRIARDAGINPKSSQRAVYQLRQVGLLLIEKRHRGQSNSYQLPAQTVGKMTTPTQNNPRQNIPGGVDKMTSQAQTKCPHNRMGPLKNWCRYKQ